MPSQKLKSENYSNLGGINTKTSPHQTGPFEFLDIVNYDFSKPGALTPVPGTSQFFGTTLTGRIGTIFEYERLSGFSQIILTANTNAYFAVAGGTPSAFKTGLLNGGQFRFLSFVDRMFGANGQDFFRWDGASVSSFSLPPGISTSWGVTAQIGGSLTAGVTGVFYTGYGYINDRGYIGPSSAGITITLNGATFNSILYYGMTAPAGFGISSIALFKSVAGNVDLYRTASVVPGTTLYLDSNLALSTDLAQPYLWFTMAPRYMDIVNNQLFAAGFSSMLSTVVWSDIGEPEGIKAEWQNEVRTNDGDRITGLKAFQGDGIVFKNKSMHRFRPNSPDDIQFAEITDQYGCISDRTVCVYDSTMLFLDRQGIVSFNGSEVKVMSTRVDEIFRRMNVDAAIDTACAIHNKERKEIKFAIPVDGATMNNCIVVYDYNVNAFYYRRGLNVSHLAMVKGGTSSVREFYGNYAGTVYSFGTSLISDSGNGMTCSFKTRYIHDAGDTNEVLWRRLFLNCPPAGATVTFNVNLRPNYGNTIASTHTMYSNPFQTRIDFGVSSKSLSVEVIQVGFTAVAQVEGFALAYRFLRPE